MTGKENLRKCIKCGSSSTQDASLTLHRFPKPGRTNSLRCELWAKFCFPNESWSSPEFQRKLHSQHKMLCSKHFKKTCFVEGKLFRTAAPSEECDENTNPSESNSVFVPVAGPSRYIQPLMENKASVNSPNIVQSSTNILYDQDKICEPVAVSAKPAGWLIENNREKRLYVKMKRNMRKVCRLQKTIKHLKNESFINVISKNKSVAEILKSKVSPTFALLLQGELQNFKRTARARRWNDEAKITALRLYKRSPTCYKLLRRLICLPAPGTLKSLLSKFHMGVGVNKNIFNVLKRTVKFQKPSDNEYVLMFDEMSIKKNLAYNKKQDCIEGYQDHGSQGRSQQIASYALVFMVAGIRKPVKQPVAYYLSGGSVSADRLAVLLKEVLKNCFDAGINIAATVCDLDAVNKRALTNLGATVEQPFIKFENKEIVTIFDTPHLLKCFRNLFLKYDIKCSTNITSDNKPGIGMAKWSYIKKFYELDNNNPNFVFAPALREDHLNPNTKQKMKVKLAAQVLSHSVAAGMHAKIGTGELSSDAITTANVISNMDKLFDSVNSYTPDRRRGKPLATYLRENSGHFEFFREMKLFFKNLTFVGCRSPPPSQEGWIWSLNGIERLWHNLKKKHSIKSLSTRRLQQDPLENLFGCIRSNCGANTNPTAGQFAAGLKTAVLSNLSHIGSGNCEMDENEVILSNFKTLLTSKLKSKPTDAAASTHEADADATLENEIEKNVSVSVWEQSTQSNIEETSGEMQACAYVCGFIVKNNPNNKCQQCKKVFVSDTQEEVHDFIDFKEYEGKNSLTYASKNLINTVEKSASIINSYLNKDAYYYTENLKISVKDLLKKSIKWDFLQGCDEHKHYNLFYIINSIFHICVKRFCTLKNRQFSEEANLSALKRKIDILKHK